MLNAIKRWIAGEQPGNDWAEVMAWAQKQGHGFKRAKEDEGFVLDGNVAGRSWRLEWGPPQRAYITGHELRLRMELQLPSGLQMLIMTRALMESLERETFERYTESNQTLIDVSTPEEMRWLAMFPKVNFDIPKQVRSHYAGVAADPVAAANWVDAEFGQQLVNAAGGLLQDQPPFVLMTLRGRVYLRLQLEDPSPAALEQSVALFQAAAGGALRAAGSMTDTQNQEWPTTASTAWHTDIMPEEPKR